MRPLALLALGRLAVARARRRPARWLLAVAGIALATGFAGALFAQATITADASARAVLRSLPQLERAVRITWQGVVTPGVERRAGMLFDRLGLRNRADVVLMNPVRLGGIVVRPAAIRPLSAWVARFPRVVTTLGPCVQESCPVLLAGGSLGRVPLLAAPGVRMPVLARMTLRSPVPLGFVPSRAAGGAPPLLLSGDPRGLRTLAGLGATYRSETWIAPVPVSALHAWELGTVERRLQHVQSALLGTGSAFTMSAPFAGLDAARSEAAAAPQRLLLTGGGAAAALLLFVLLAAGGVRRDQLLELERLRHSGARTFDRMAFLLLDSGLLCGLGVLLGSGLGVAASAVLAHASGAPAGAVLTHGLLRSAWPEALAGCWIAGTALLAGSVLVHTPRLADVLAIAAAAALALALNLDVAASDALTPLVAPLCALAAGVLVYRGAAMLLRLAERGSRRGPLMMRLALIGLARSPGPPSLAIAFIAVSIGLGGFALCYRATLLRGTADQAADRVPLDGIVAAGPGFTRPLALATPAQWRRLTGGRVWAVRRTEASLLQGAGTVTVPALGLPSTALERIHGWRAADGSAALPTLARRLISPGPVRTPGPRLDPHPRELSLRASSSGFDVEVLADLREPGGGVSSVSLGRAGPDRRELVGRLPPGSWELEALELREPTGLEVTNGHQNGENPAAATQFTTTVRLSSLGVAGTRLTSWRGAGAVRSVSPRGGAVVIRFAGTGAPGILRPAQPSDTRPVPVLVGGALPHAGRLALTIDDAPLSTRVVGVLRRFPTLPSDAAGFVVADQPTLAAALDAQAPGQGEGDEIWQLGGRDVRPFADLSYTRRVAIERQLRDAPLARGVLGALVAGAALAGALAVVGLLVALLGSVRDPRVELDLIAQGVGGRGVRREIRMRLAIAGTLGVVAGIGIALVLTRLSVAAVRAGTGLALPHPPLVMTAPWPQLGLWPLAAAAALGLAGWLATGR